MKTKKIHSTAIIEDSVVLANNVEVGPYTVIEGNTTIGEGTKIGPFCHLGGIPQDRNYSGETSTLKIGKNCRLSDYVMIETGVEGTVIGDECFFMTHSGIAHDTVVGNRCSFTVNSGTVGNCLIEDDVMFGIGVKTHQQVRIGRMSILGGNSFIKRDVLPYSLVEHSSTKGINLVGMRRAGFDNKSIQILSNLYKKLLNREINLLDWAQFLEDNYDEQHITNIVQFVRQNSRRSFLMGNEK